MIEKLMCFIFNNKFIYNNKFNYITCDVLYRIKKMKLII